jgi:ABC-type multidrug transport system fused ATPase/permease subunit
MEYSRLEPEEKNDKSYPEEGEYTDDPTHVIPKNWPSKGEIEFRDVTIRYDLKGPDILTNINLKIHSGERVAIVGRTGSGKSTLVLSLLRFTNIVSGTILYDGVDITKIPRKRLRQALTIIPQEAVLFSGTVESNLDPTGEIPKEALLKVLESTRGIASFEFHSNAGASTDDEQTNDTNATSNDASNGESSGSSETAMEETTRTADAAESTAPKGLELSTTVAAKGENFSHGQRQVLSLCRALVRKSRLMLLDEATASMDYETDRGIQEVLRHELDEAGGDRTLVTIAHRLRTIIDYDTVVVMSNGKMVE